MAMRSWIPGTALILLGGVLTAGTAVAVDRLRPPDRVVAERVFYPDANYIRPLCFGFTEVAADLIWVQSLIYYGVHMTGDQQLPWLDRMIETAIDLDPRFEGLYRWSVSSATWRSRLRGFVPDIQLWLANHYAKLGERRLPGSWEFPYLLGANWYYDRDDARRARYYWERAVELPGADPDLLDRLSAIHHRLGDTEKAIMRLQDLLRLTTEEGQREEFERRLEFFEAELARSLSSMPEDATPEEVTPE